PSAAATGRRRFVAGSRCRADGGVDRSADAPDGRAAPSCNLPELISMSRNSAQTFRSPARGARIALFCLLLSPSLAWAAGWLWGGARQASHTQIEEVPSPVPEMNGALPGGAFFNRPMPQGSVVHGPIIGDVIHRPAASQASACLPPLGGPSPAAPYSISA